MRVLRFAGAHSVPILRKAAQVFGKKGSRDLVSHDIVSWVGLFTAVNKHAQGPSFLEQLAPRVGVSIKDASPSGIAAGVVRHDLRGEALELVLDSLAQGPSPESQAILTQASGMFGGPRHEQL